MSAAVQERTAAADDGTGKSPDAYRTIGEASKIIGVPQHVLRFWETRFSQIRPLKRAGNRRYYRPGDLALLQKIRALLHEEGYSIRGVQKLFRSAGVKGMLGDAPATPPADTAQAAQPPQPSQSSQNEGDLRDVLGELQEIRELLR